MIKILYKVIILMTTILVTFYTANFNTHYGYDYIWVLPLLYFVGSSLIFFKNFNKENIFISIIMIVLYLRYVLLSFLLVFTGFNVERSNVPPLESSYNQAVVLMTIEGIAIFSVLIFVVSKVSFSWKNFNLISIKNYNIYFLFICFSIILFIIQPALWGKISFIVPQITGDNQETSLIGSLTYFCLYVSKYLLIVLVTSKFYSLYIKSNSSIYIFFNYLFAVIFSLVIFGHNRADFLIAFFAVLFLLQMLYRKKAYIYNFFSVILAPVIIVIITQSRAAISADNNLPFLESMTSMLNAYLGGIYNVAIAIETKEYFGEFINLQNIIYDVFRSFLGLNIFIKNMDAELTNHLFNYRIYGSGHVSQILPSVGQGYFYFGYILSPLFTILLILLAVYLMKKAIELKSIDLVLFLLIPIFRLTLSPVQNISIMMNDLSSILVIFLPLYFISNILFRSKNKTSYNDLGS